MITAKLKAAEEKITWSVGAVNSSNGSLVDMSSRIRTNMFAVTRGAVITAANGAEFCPVFYDKSGNFVFSPNAYDLDGVLEIPAGQYVYMRLMARNSENTNETMTAAYGENITVTFGSETASWSVGTISTIDGSDADNYNNRIRTGFIAIGEGVTVRAANNAQINVVYYDENYKILPTGNNCGWTTEWSSANAPAATVYIRVVAKDGSDKVLTVDYSENITLTYGCIHCYEAVVTPPTCTEQGYTTYTCTLCGDSYVGDYVEALGHSFEGDTCTVCGFAKLPYRRLTYFTVDVQTGDGKIYTDNAVLYLPANYTPDGDPVKLVIYCKQGASQITASSNPIESVGFYNYLISLGYAVLGVDGVPDAWRDELGICERAVGNPVAVQGTEKAYDYVVENYNIAADGCFISGYSQGGHYAQNVIDLTDIPILAAAEQSPVCSMRYHQWDLNATVTVNGTRFTKGARLNVARIYGFPTFATNAELLALEYDANLVAQYDPWVRNAQNVYTGFVQKSNLWYLPDGTSLDDITMTKTAKCPVKIWCAEDDTAISADVMKVFVKAIQNAGGIAEISVTSSGGHGFFQKQAAVGTFTENGKTYKTLPIAVEIAQWFEKYGGYACEHSYANCVCTKCGEVNHGYKTSVTLPTCTELGYTTYTCTLCGDSCVGDYVEALGHTSTAGLCTTCGHDSVEAVVDNGTLTVTCDELEPDTLIWLVSYDGNGKFVAMRRVTLGEALTLPAGERYILLFVDENWTPLRTELSF